MVKSDEFVIRKTGFKFWVHHLIVYLRQFFQSFYMAQLLCLYNRDKNNTSLSEFL